MHLRNTLNLIAALALTLLPLSAVAQTPASTTPASTAPAPGVTATTGSLRGRATDADKAVIPGVNVTLTSSSGKNFTTQTTGDGSYLIPNLAPGVYSLATRVPGFTDFSSASVTITAAAATRVNLHLLPSISATVNVVAENTQQLSTSSDNNASTLTLTGKDLDALSDDPDELSDELNALAGPAAGPNGGQIYIDGFTGGTLPPKSSIREIRINQNPFSAQFEHIGYGRIEVFTKPGTDKLHGNVQLSGNDNTFNTAAMVGAGPQPPYHTLMFQESLSGPINKTASYNLGTNYRIIQDNNVINTTVLDANNNPANLIQSVFYPQTRFETTPRFDLQLSSTNTLTARYQFEHNSQTNAGIGGNKLATAGYNSTETNNELQLSDSQTFGGHIISDLRFEYEHDANSNTAQYPQLTTNVSGAFTDFGNGTGLYNATSGHWELQSYNSIQVSNHFLRVGGRLRVDTDSDTNTSGNYGAFTYGQTSAVYGNVAAYLPYNSNPTLNCQPAAGTASNAVIPISGICNYAATLKHGGVSTALNIGPTQFNASYGNTAVSAALADLALYFEDEWKISPSFTFTTGLRYETQNHITEHHDLAPRVSAAWGLMPRNGSPLFVLRGGFGVFYDRFALSNVEQVIRFSGANAEQQVLVDPPAPPSPTKVIAFNSCSTTASCIANGTSSSQTTYTQSPNLRDPYTIQFGGSLEHQITKAWTATATYLNSRGEHQLYSQNLAAVPGSGVTGIVNQYVSEGIYKQNQLIIQSSYRGPAGTSLFGYYTFSHANADTNSASYFPSVPNQITADYGRASFDVRQKLFFGGSAQLPYRITLSPFLIANSGAPFNITLGEDLNGDTIFNDRPAFATSATLPQNLVVSKYGNFDKGTTAGQSPIPINYGTAPAQFAFNLRVSKTIGFGSKIGGANTSQGGQVPNGPPPGGPSSSHHDHGGMGFGGGGTSTGRKYNLTLGAQGLNLFNVVNYTSPIGVLSSPQFGQQTKLAGSIFSSNTAVRRITLQASFTF
jgi:hypothetical protein